MNAVGKYIMIAWQCWGVLVGVSNHKVSTIGHPILHVPVSRLREIETQFPKLIRIKSWCRKSGYYIFLAPFPIFWHRHLMLLPAWEAGHVSMHQ